MLKKILNQQQSELSWQWQITLAVCSTVHLYLMYRCLVTAPVTSGQEILSIYYLCVLMKLKQAALNLLRE